MRRATHIAPLLLLALACSEDGSSAGTECDSDTQTDINTADCFQGDYTIENDEDAEAFQPYPCISGNLYVSGENLTALSLPNLVKVGGSLEFDNVVSIESLDLSALKSVTSNVEIVNLFALADLDGLSGLTIVGGGLLIGFSSLTSVQMNALVKVGGILSVAHTDALTEIEMSCLSYVGGLHFEYNDSLTDLDGLSSLTSIPLDLEVFANHALPDCEVCELLEQLTTGPSATDVYANLDDECTPVPESCP